MLGGKGFLPPVVFGIWNMRGQHSMPVSGSNQMVALGVGAGPAEVAAAEVAAAVMLQFPLQLVAAAVVLQVPVQLQQLFHSFPRMRSRVEVLLRQVVAAEAGCGAAEVRLAVRAAAAAAVLQISHHLILFLLQRVVQRGAEAGCGAAEVAAAVLLPY